MPNKADGQVNRLDGPIHLDDPFSNVGRVTKSLEDPLCRAREMATWPIRPTALHAYAAEAVVPGPPRYQVIGRQPMTISTSWLTAYVASARRTLELKSE